MRTTTNQTRDETEKPNSTERTAGGTVQPETKIAPESAAAARARSNFIVNPPFRGELFAANKKLSEEDWEKLEKAIPETESLKFVIIGDLNIHSKYAKSLLAVTDKLIYGFDDSFEGGMKTHSYDKVRRAYVKRYYGNAMLVFSMDESDREFVDLTKEYTNFIRFSYKVASLYDAAANFIQNGRRQGHGGGNAGGGSHL